MPKVSLEHVTADSGSSFACQRQRLRRFTAGYHFHPQYELTLIQKGGGRRMVGDREQTFGPGDMVLLGPNLPHAYRSRRDAPSHALVVKFPAGLLSPDFLALPEMRAVARLLGQAARGIRFDPPPAAVRNLMSRAMSSAPGPEQLGRFVQLLGALARLHARPLTSEGFAPPAARAGNERLRRVLRFLETRWDGEITLAQAARVAGLHPQSLSRFLRKKLGRCFVAYVAELRLGHAAQLLLNTDRTVADIAFSCGFGNLSHFNRAFRAFYGRTPRAYRLQEDAPPPGTRSQRTMSRTQPSTRKPGGTRKKSRSSHSPARAARRSASSPRASSNRQPNSHAQRRTSARQPSEGGSPKST